MTRSPGRSVRASSFRSREGSGQVLEWTRARGEIAKTCDDWQPPLRACDHHLISFQTLSRELIEGMRVANASAHMQPPRSPSVSGARRDSLLENSNQRWRANVLCVLVATVLLIGLVLQSATPARAAQNRQAENPPKNDPELVGSIEGEVVDRDTRQPVSGAIVLVEGTSLSAVVGNDGRFRIRNVPPPSTSSAPKDLATCRSHPRNSRFR